MTSIWGKLWLRGSSPAVAGLFAMCFNFPSHGENEGKQAIEPGSRAALLVFRANWMLYNGDFSRPRSKKIWETIRVFSACAAHEIA